MLATSSDPQMAHNAISYNTEDGTTFINTPLSDSTLINSNIIIPIDKMLAQVFIDKSFYQSDRSRPLTSGIRIYP
jgi:hypothetical protein